MDQEELKEKIRETLRSLQDLAPGIYVAMPLADFNPGTGTILCAYDELTQMYVANALISFGSHIKQGRASLN